MTATQCPEHISCSGVLQSTSLWDAGRGRGSTAEATSGADTFPIGSWITTVGVPMPILLKYCWTQPCVTSLPFGSNPTRWQCPEEVGPRHPHGHKGGAWP